MPGRDLPARPNLDHLKNEAKALRNAFESGDAEAVQRVHAVLGAINQLKLTEAQRVIAREYGFPTFTRLRAHVQALRSLDEAITAFLNAVFYRDADAARQVLTTEPRIASNSLHVAAVLGLADDVRRLITENPARVHEGAGQPAADPLLWLGYSPFHGESAERDRGLFEAAVLLLDAGADPNSKDGRYGVPVLYAVTGMNNAPRIARLLLERGASPTDGESVFHAAERYNIEALELLLEYGVDLNYVGDWGNTAIYFLLRYHRIDQEPRVKQGVDWLLEHDADPNVLCGRERENALHVAVRRGQSSATIRMFLDRITDVDAPRGDGLTAWQLAKRAGFDEVATLLEEHGARARTLSPVDQLLAACSRGDADRARALSSPQLIDSLTDGDAELMVEAAAENRAATVLACIAAGFPIDSKDPNGATALHYAALHGNAAIVRALLAARADFTPTDREHNATPLGWACFGTDHVRTESGDYTETVRALVKAGARLARTEQPPADPAVRAALGPST